MANKYRGEVTLKAGDKTYTLDLSLNALCEAEGILGRTIMKIAEELNDPERLSVTSLRGILCAALREHHGDVSVKEAGRIAGVAGFQATLDAIGLAFQASMPAEAGDQDPQTAAA